MSHRPEPSAALEAAYRVVAERMAGLPVVNPALSVEALHFQRWEGLWLGVVVTPWFMNLTLTPDDPARWVALPVGGKRRLRFPAGDFEFIGAHDPGIGDFQVCSLFSPMDRFADQPGARLVAQLALRALFDPANAEPPADTVQPEPPAPRGEASDARLPAGEPAVDEGKRRFLGGRAAPRDPSR